MYKEWKAKTCIGNEKLLYVKDLYIRVKYKKDLYTQNKDEKDLYIENAC